MTKLQWQAHITEAKNGQEWTRAQLINHAHNCPQCAARRKTRARNNARKAENQILRDICGTSAATARRDMGL